MIHSEKEQEIIQIQRQSDMQKKDEQKRAEFEEEMEGPTLAQATSWVLKYIFKVLNSEII